MKILLVLAASLTAALGLECQSSDWKLLPGGQRCWLFHDFAYSYPLAYTYCKYRILGSFLASLRSSSDGDTLYAVSEAEKSTSDYLWFGLQEKVVNKTYAWEDGNSWSYRNWKTGEEPAVCEKQCVAFERATKKWSARRHCMSIGGFACELPATAPCNEKIQVTQGSPVKWETKGASLRQTVVAFNCTKEVSVVNKGKEVIVARMTYYVPTRSYVRMSNAVTGMEIGKVTNFTDWVWTEIDTGSESIKFEVWTDKYSEVGVSVTFLTRLK